MSTSTYILHRWLGVLCVLAFAAFALCEGCGLTPTHAQTVSTAPVWIPSSDITAQLNAACLSGSGGYGPNQAVITLPAGEFLISGTVNLQMSVLRGTGASTAIRVASDLGAGKVAFTSSLGQAHPCEIDDLSISGPPPKGTMPTGIVPNQMDGVHLYDDCILRRVTVNYFNNGVIVDGNHHVLDTVTAQKNYNGLEYIVSSDESYYDDYIVDCNLTSNQNAGIYVAPNATMGGSTVLRTHTGLEPYSIYLGHNSTISLCQFLQTQFEGVGNGDIVDADGTSVISGNFFAACSGWGGEYNVALAGQPTAPVIRVGSWMWNDVQGGSGGSGSDSGPPCGDMSCTSCEGNTWTAAPGLPNTIANGQLTPITCSVEPNGVGGNAITAGGLTIGLYNASAALKVGQLVEVSPSHFVVVGPASGKGIGFGVSLGAVKGGQVAWIATRGVLAIPCDAGCSPGCNTWIKVDPLTGLGMAAASATDGETIGLVVNATVTPPQVRIAF